tara:strand:+ start:826 stop:1026 length:201 start_codon:yes stop_codon:yes gene_type:complete
MSLDNNEDLLPRDVGQLLDKLNLVFPEKSAQLGMTTEKIWFLGGQRSVINWLLELKAREDNNNEDY